MCQRYRPWTNLNICTGPWSLHLVTQLVPLSFSGLRSRRNPDQRCILFCCRIFGSRRCLHGQSASAWRLALQWHCSLHGSILFGSSRLGSLSQDYLRRTVLGHAGCYPTARRDGMQSINRPTMRYVGAVVTNPPRTSSAANVNSGRHPQHHMQRYHHCDHFVV